MDKAIIIRSTFVVAAIILLWKTAQLQLFDETMRVKAGATAIEKKVLYPSRGLMYDRNGKLVVYNDAIYDLLVIYNNINPNMDTVRFCNLLKIDRKYFIENLSKNWNSAKFSKNVPYIFISKISAEVFGSFQEHLHEFPGFIPQIRNTRGYSYPVGSHVLGYISEVDQDDIDESGGKYVARDYIGKSGLEKAYEEYLRGAKGIEYVLKDNIGREVGPYEDGIHDTAAISGADLTLTLDIELQSYAEKLMTNKIGGITAVEPSTGEVLCMISTPSYDPSLTSISRQRNIAFQNLITDSLKPLLNRTIRAEYPPGSIFKSVVALIALQEQIISPNQGHLCTGSYHNAGSDYRRCNNHALPKYIPNVEVALQYSCNSYFFDVFKRIVNKFGFRKASTGLDLVYTYLLNFGFNQTLMPELVGEEVPGMIPNSAYYDDLYETSGPWYATTIISLGIGQGELLMTTLQMANLASIIANKGYYIKPHLLKEIRDPGFTINEEFTRKRFSRITNEYWFNPVINGLERVVNAGTARRAQVPGITVCGKTGSVQNPHGESHAVFIAFAPKVNPQIALAVYVENAGGGGRYAAPIAGLLIEKYLNREIDENRQSFEQDIISTSLLPNVLP